VRPADQFIEQLGLIMEAEGFPRIAGRLFGLLLLSSEPLSLDQLAARLKVSKASVSLDARLLRQRGVVDRVSLPGDRRDYYRVAPDLFRRNMEQRLARVRSFHQALVAVRPAIAGRNRTVDDRLEQLDRSYHQMLTTMTAALESWTTQRPAGRRSS
jgi:DNA-binding transcriptional regulator GbsR (MarR family)